MVISITNMVPLATMNVKCIVLLQHIAAPLIHFNGWRKTGSGFVHFLRRSTVIYFALFGSIVALAVFSAICVFAVWLIKREGNLHPLDAVWVFLIYMMTRYAGSVLTYMWTLIVEIFTKT